MKKFFILLSMTMLPGCAVWEEAVEHGEDIQKAGEIGQEVGTAVALSAPEVGILVVLGSGVLLATGKLLKEINKDE